MRRMGLRRFEKSQWRTFLGASPSSTVKSWILDGED